MVKSDLHVLMITPVIDEHDSYGGFVIGWINNLAERVNKLNVVTLRHVEQTQLPLNVTICSLGKQSNKLSKTLFFYRQMGGVIPKVDVIFCHMFPDFTLLVAPFAKLFRKPIVTWYAHGHVDLRLRLVHWLATRIVTSAEGGFRLKSDKVLVMGQGVDTVQFSPTNRPRKKKAKKTILSLGRMTPVKEHEVLIGAADILVNEKEMRNLRFQIVGGTTLPFEEDYYQEIKRMVEKSRLGEYVEFIDFVPFDDTVRYYQDCDLFVSTCCIGENGKAGGLGKTVLEAMACGKPVVVCGEPYSEVLQPYADLCLFESHKPESLAEKLAYLIAHEDRWDEIGNRYRQNIVENHSGAMFADRLVNVFLGLAKKRDSFREAK